MKRATRSRSTAFQVLPPTLKWVPTMQPSATFRMSAMLSTLQPVLASTGVPGDGAYDALQAGLVRRLAGHRPRDEDGIGERGEDGALRARLDGTVAHRRGELGIDVEHELEIVAAEVVAQAERPGGRGLPQAHVGIVDAGEDLAREDGIGRHGQRHGRYRVPKRDYPLETSCGIPYIGRKEDAMTDEHEHRLENLEVDVATLMARHAAILSIIQLLVLRLDDAAFGHVIELLDFPMPPGMGEAATRKGDHFFHEFSTHLLDLRKRMHD